MITLNGKIMTDADQLSIAELLLRERYESSRVAVECNGEIVPRAQYQHTRLHDGDAMEVVHFVGGGSVAQNRLKTGSNGADASTNATARLPLLAGHEGVR